MLPPWNPARRGCSDAKESTPPEVKVEFETIASGDDGAMQLGQACELDHGIDDLLSVLTGMRLNHLALLNDGCSAGHAARRELAACLLPEEGTLPPISSSSSPDGWTVDSG